MSALFKKYNITRGFVLVLLIVLATCFLYYESFYKKQMAKILITKKSIDTYNVSIAALEAVGGDIKQKEKSLKKLTEKHSALVEEQKRLFSMFPTKTEASKMLEDIISEEKFLALDFEWFYPSNAIPTARGYSYIPIRIKVSGGFTDIGEYIKYIENLPRTFVIEDVHYKLPKNKFSPNSCEAEIKGKTYILGTG